MKRTKQWWRGISKEDRSFLVYYERLSNNYTSFGGYMPDDCCDCNVCDGPSWLTSTCKSCTDRYHKIIDEANKWVENINTKSCISCKRDGHTYLECEDVPFGALFIGAMGLNPEPFTGISRDELVDKLNKNDERLKRSE